MKIEIQKWGREEQTNKVLKALSDTKAILDRFYEKGYSISWELDELIKKIEGISNKVKIQNSVIKKIKMEIGKYYEGKGRRAVDGLSEIKPQEEILLKKLKGITDKAKIPEKYLVISKLKMEDEDIYSWEVTPKSI